VGMAGLLGGGAALVPMSVGITGGVVGEYVGVSVGVIVAVCVGDVVAIVGERVGVVPVLGPVGVLELCVGVIVTGGVTV